MKELEKEILRLKEEVNGDFKPQSGLIKTTNQAQISRNHSNIV